jgi:hypothetical protein
MATVPEAHDDPGIDFPEAWLWEEHGERVSGNFIRFTRGYTKSYGPKTIAVLEVDGIERSIWLTATVLFRKFEDELRDRPEHKLAAGERITVKRGEMVESPDAMGAYRNFTVVFHDKPELEVEDLFDLGDDKPAQPEAKSAERARAAANAGERPQFESDDEIPF